MIYFVNRLDPRSIEYKYASPAHYFVFPDKILEIDFNNLVNFYFKDEIVIFTGGDVIRKSNVLDYVNIYALGKILWGSGIDNVVISDYDLSFIKKSTLAGARDFGLSNNIYVPDVSCMHSAFDKQREATEEMVLYFEGEDLGLNLPKKSNLEPKTLSEALDFLASGNIVVTNSFYGAYWATLLNRKVIVIDNPHMKYLSLKYPPTFCLDKNNLEQYCQFCRSFPGSLEDSRKRNREYFVKVQNIINALLEIPEKREKLKNKLLKYKNIYKTNPFDPEFIKSEIASFIQDTNTLDKNTSVFFVETNYDEYLFSSHRFELNCMLFALNSKTRPTFGPSSIQRAFTAIKKAYGNVLIIGLDIGYSAIKIAEKNNVNSVTVVEEDMHLIDIFNNVYKDKTAMNKISFTQDDNRNGYDFIYVEDINKKREGDLFAGKEYIDLLSVYNGGEADEDSLAFLAQWCFTKVHGNLTIGDIFNDLGTKL